MSRCMTLTVTGNEFSSVNQVLYIFDSDRNMNPAVDQHLRTLRQYEKYFFAQTGGKLKNASQMSVRVHEQSQIFLFSTKIDTITNF